MTDYEITYRLFSPREASCNEGCDCPKCPRADLAAKASLSTGAANFPSAIQMAWLAGSRFASCRQSAARKISSNRVVIGAPAREPIFPWQTYDRYRSRHYCPHGHCPNVHVTLTEPSGAADADTKNDHLDDGLKCAALERRETLPAVGLRHRICFEGRDPSIIGYLKQLLGAESQLAALAGSLRLI